MSQSAQGEEEEVKTLARLLFRKAAQHKPSIFEAQDWLGKMIEWSLEDEFLRSALFRFIDVLPALNSAEEIGQHLEQYFAKVDHAFGRLLFFVQAFHAGWLVAPMARQNVIRLARRFIVEDEIEALKRVLENLRAEPAAFTLDVVGEATVSDKEAVAIQQRCLELIENLSSVCAAWRTVGQIDESPRGPLPRVNLSVKVSSLCARFDPLDPDSKRLARERLRPLAQAAGRFGAALTLDMEQFAFKDLTLAIFRSLLEEKEFASEPRMGIAMQAYHHEAERDLMELIHWARQRERRIGVRLVKGAYWDSEIAWARQKSWPIPVFLQKAETDANYERLTRKMLENNDIVDCAFASHNIRSLAYAIVAARQLRVAIGDYEIQMLYGMGEPIRQAIIENGQRVRVYVPVGKLLPGMAYLIRRLMENTSNTSFLRQTYAEEEAIDRLISTPVPSEPAGSPAPQPGRKQTRETIPPFRNQPPLDFSRQENRTRFSETLLVVKARFGRNYPLWIGGVEVQTESWLESVDPARPKVVIGRVPVAGLREVERALEHAAKFFPEWRKTPATERARILFRAAEEMRERRLELAAWEVFEVGKGWREADADIAEAIDYLEYYGREILRLGQPRLTQQLPGETNVYLYEPRGVAAVIAPWNFPLAILTGMTAASLVTGNCVILKPAEQSPVTGALLMEILRAAGLPPLACQLVQGGGELGSCLVRHPAVHLIAFTGSREVGLEILRLAHDQPRRQEHVKRVICEMGGKNAILVDADADLDEALVSIVESAFGYQGQKCSAASRLILVNEVYEVVLARLVEAVRSLKIGAPEDPRNFVGPVIDAVAHARVAGYIDLGKREGTCLVEREVPNEGFFIGPTLFGDIEPRHRLAQEEIFGPVLTVLKARDFDHALEIATRSSYALTGGLFSRSPAHINKAKEGFRVGNLYINRGITGAIVERQPFGGLKLSGVGSKAGGPDYLLQFLEPRTISENTLRHGFAPPQEAK